MAPCDKSYASLTSDEKSVIQAKMQPGELSTLGYLAKDEDLDDVIAKDIEDLQHTDLTAKNILDALRTVIGRHERHKELYDLEDPLSKESSHGTHIEILDRLMRTRIDADAESEEWCLWDRYFAPIEYNDIELMVMSMTWGGAAICPFQSDDNESYHGYDYGSRDYCIYNPENNVSVLFNDLNLHMAEHHSFWEGDVVYRLDPIKVIECLRLNTKTVFVGKKITDMFWSFTSATGDKEGTYRDNIMRWASEEGADLITVGDVQGIWSSKSPPPFPDQSMSDFGGTELQFYCWLPKDVKDVRIDGAILTKANVLPEAMNGLVKKERTYYLLESEHV